MFGAIKSLWHQSGITASVDGVLREVGKGNAVEAQKWYFKLKKECYTQAQQRAITPKQAEDEALTTIPPEKLVEYLGIVGKLRQPGGIFFEIDEWLVTNDPTS